RQRTLNQLEKQNNWSVELQGGAQQNIGSYQNQMIQPYFSALVRYNLGSIPSNNKLDKSLNSYMNWQNKQVTGIQRNLSQLINTISSLKAAEQERLTH